MIQSVLDVLDPWAYKQKLFHHVSLILEKPNILIYYFHITASMYTFEIHTGPKHCNTHFTFDDDESLHKMF